MARGVPGKRKPAIGPHQKRAIELLKKQLLSGGTKTIEEILLDAGYAPESARQQMNVMIGIRPHLQPFIKKMEAHRERVLERMENKVDIANYGELVRSLDVLTKNIQLLGGKATQKIEVDDERRAALDALIDD